MELGPQRQSQPKRGGPFVVRRSEGVQLWRRTAWHPQSRPIHAARLEEFQGPGRRHGQNKEGQSTGRGDVLPARQHNWELFGERGTWQILKKRSEDYAKMQMQIEKTKYEESAGSFSSIFNTNTLKKVASFLPFNVASQFLNCPQKKSLSVSFSFV